MHNNVTCSGLVHHVVFFLLLEHTFALCADVRYDANFDAESDLKDPKVMILGEGGGGAQAFVRRESGVNFG